VSCCGGPAEGVGLWLRKRWAEWLTVIATSLLVPLELYELVRRATAQDGRTDRQHPDRFLPRPRRPRKGARTDECRAPAASSNSTPVIDEATTRRAPVGDVTRLGSCTHRGAFVAAGIAAADPRCQPICRVSAKARQPRAFGKSCAREPVADPVEARRLVSERVQAGRLVDEHQLREFARATHSPRAGRGCGQPERALRRSRRCPPRSRPRARARAV
jgi:hypothetical protein